MDSLTFMLLIAHVVAAILGMLMVLLRRLVHPVNYGVIGVSLDVLLQVLRTFERLAAELASMRFQRYVDSNMRRDVIPLDHLNMAVSPRTLQV